ncbi:MAG: methylcrotonoyl-CoA carboxylase, partial [Candidatus Eremiobacteraeota bacterium]|nr:methylcrotonoyl-CoA carboxylase [Candidatus Eremiobacteraeota bacterium]
MAVLASHVDVRTREFEANAAHLRGLVEELRGRLSVAAQGGGAEATARHRARNKMTARERVARLIDPGSPFLELSPLAAFGMYKDASPSAGIVTGIGSVQGRDCMLVANDATVKGGT